MHRCVALVGLFLNIKDDRRAVLHRGHGVGDGRGLFEVDLHHRCSVVSGGLTGGDHSGHRLTGVENAIRRERLLGARDVLRGQVAGDHHVDDAGHRSCGGGFDRPDARARQVTEHELHVEQAPDVQVRRVAGRAHNLVAAFEPSRGRADSAHLINCPRVL